MLFPSLLQVLDRHAKNPILGLAANSVQCFKIRDLHPMKGCKQEKKEEVSNLATASTTIKVE